MRRRRVGPSRKQGEVTTQQAFQNPALPTGSSVPGYWVENACVSRTLVCAEQVLRMLVPVFLHTHSLTCTLSLTHVYTCSHMHTLVQGPHGFGIILQVLCGRLKLKTGRLPPGLAKANRERAPLTAAVRDPAAAFGSSCAPSESSGSDQMPGQARGGFKSPEFSEPAPRPAPVWPPLTDALTRPCSQPGWPTGPAGRG